MKKIIFCYLLTIPAFAWGEGDATNQLKTRDSEFLLLFGLSQPIIMHGGNVEINYRTRRFVFEYSHGFLLNLSANPALTMTADERSQNLDIFARYSTGGGFGYRFTPEFNLRAEVKAHRFEVTHGQESIAYNAYSVGLGAYYCWFPFGNQHFAVVPSVRFWPNVATTLSGNQYTFSDGVMHQAHDFLLFVNISLGYRF